VVCDEVSKEKLIIVEAPNNQIPFENPALEISLVLSPEDTAIRSILGEALDPSGPFNRALRRF